MVVCKHGNKCTGNKCNFDHPDGQSSHFWDHSLQKLMPRQQPQQVAEDDVEDDDDLDDLEDDDDDDLEGDEDDEDVDLESLRTQVRALRDYVGAQADAEALRAQLDAERSARAEAHSVAEALKKLLVVAQVPMEKLQQESQAMVKAEFARLRIEFAENGNIRKYNDALHEQFKLAISCIEELKEQLSTSERSCQTVQGMLELQRKVRPFKS